MEYWKTRLCCLLIKRIQPPLFRPDNSKSRNEGVNYYVVSVIFLRYSVGVIPVCLLNILLKCITVSNPHATEISEIFILSSESSLHAYPILMSAIYSLRVLLVFALKKRQNAEGFMAEKDAISFKLMLVVYVLLMKAIIFSIFLSLKTVGIGS